MEANHSFNPAFSVVWGLQPLPSSRTSKPSYVLSAQRHFLESVSLSRWPILNILHSLGLCQFPQPGPFYCEEGPQFRGTLGLQFL